MAQRSLRAAGVISVVGVLAFVLLITLQANQVPVSWWMQLVPVALWAVGPLTMIVHLNVSRSLTADEKAVWRSHLQWRGPLIPAVYLLTIRSKGE